MPSNAVFRSAVATVPCEQVMGAVLELHHDAFERRQRGLDLEHAQHDGLVGAEQVAVGDAVDEGVADLTGRAGDGHVDGSLQGGMPGKLPSCSGQTPDEVPRTASSSSRASVSSAMRSAAPDVLAAVVGMREAEQPPEPPLHVLAIERRGRAQAEHLHRPPALGGDAAPDAPRRRRRGAGAPGANGRGPGTPSSSRPDPQSFRQRAGPGDRGVDRAEREPAGSPPGASMPP